MKRKNVFHSSPKKKVKVVVKRIEVLKKLDSLIKSMNEKKVLGSDFESSVKLQRNNRDFYIHNEMSLFDMRSIEYGNISITFEGKTYAYIAYNIYDLDPEDLLVIIEMSGSSEHVNMLLKTLVYACKTTKTRIGADDLASDDVSQLNKGFKINELNNDLDYENLTSEIDAKNDFITMIKSSIVHSEYHKILKKTVNEYNVYAKKCEENDKDCFVYRPKVVFLSQFDQNLDKKMRIENPRCSNISGSGAGVVFVEPNNKEIVSILLSRVIDVSGIKTLHIVFGCTNHFFRRQKLSYILSVITMYAAVLYNTQYKPKLQLMTSNVVSKKYKGLLVGKFGFRKVIKSSRSFGVVKKRSDKNLNLSIKDYSIITIEQDQDSNLYLPLTLKNSTLIETEFKEILGIKRKTPKYMSDIKKKEISDAEEKLLKEKNRIIEKK